MINYFSSNQSIGQMSRVYANDLGDWGSIPGRVIPKPQKMVLDNALLSSIIRWRSGVKWSNPGNGIAPSPSPRFCSYWKGSLQVILDYGRQLYFLLIFPLNKEYIALICQSTFSHFPWIFHVIEVQYIFRKDHIMNIYLIGNQQLIEIANLILIYDIFSWSLTSLDK